MARTARIKSTTGMYNIIAKGTGCLFKNDDDYNFFIDIMDEYNFEIYAFALTKNAVCMAVKESEKGIGADFKPLVTKYARYYNRTHNTTGKLFCDRFKSEPINNDNDLKNSMALLAALPTELGIDGYVSETDGEYSMIDFYARMIGKKKKNVQRNKKTKTDKKPKAQKPVLENIEKPKSEKKNLPTWLL